MILLNLKVEVKFNKNLILNKILNHFYLKIHIIQSNMIKIYTIKK
jgi:hypothetical protein